MSQISLDHSEANIASKIWPYVLTCICVLMVATISPPEDFKVNSFGTASILPPAILKLTKIVGRGATILILAYSLYLVWRTPRRWKTARVLLPIIGFSMLAIFSVAWSAAKGVSLSQAATFATLIALAHLIGTIWKGEEDTSRLLKCCSIVLFMIATGLMILYFVWPDLGALTRNSSGLFHSTSAGGSASLGIVILVASRVIWGWQWTRRLIVPATLMHLTTMMIGANRWSFAAMALVCLVLFSVMAHKAVVASTTLGLATILVVYICLDPGLLLLDGFIEKIGVAAAQGQTQSQLSNLSGRSEMWQKIWDSFLESPLIGHGYFVTSESGRLHVWGVWGNWTAHNLCLQLLATMGVIGAGLFFLGIASVAFPVFLKLGTPDRSVHRLAVFLLAVCLWFVVWSLLNESVLGPLSPESVVFAVVLGLGAAISIGSSGSVQMDEDVPSSGTSDGENQ